MLEAQLAKYENFFECVILAVRFERQQTMLRVFVEYPWGAGHPPPSDSNVPIRLVELTFDPVQEVRFVNGLSEYQLTHPEELGWGLNEIASIEVRDDEAALAPYRSTSVQMHHAVILWERTFRDGPERAVDIVYGQLTIQEADELPKVP